MNLQLLNNLMHRRDELLAEYISRHNILQKHTSLDPSKYTIFENKHTCNVVDY